MIGRIAFGEQAGAGDAAHVRSCPDCAAEVEALRAVDGGLREISRVVPREAPRVAPPPAVWDRIAASTGVRATPRTAEVERHADVVPPPPVPLPRRRRLTPLLVAVAATAAVLGAAVGGLGTWAATRDDPGGSVVASTPLRALGSAAPDATGSAVVVRSAGGTALDLDVTGLRAGDGFLEVWMIDRSVTKMVPVGVLRGDRGQFTLPAGIDLRDYPIVDISVEPLDGDPAHSGDSVLRGTIPE